MLKIDISQFVKSNINQNLRLHIRIYAWSVDDYDYVHRAMMRLEQQRTIISKVRHDFGLHVDKTPPPTPKK